MIADLGINHVERHVLRCGFTTQKIEHDYGIDLLLFTYDSDGAPENGDIRLQVKATEHLEVLTDRRTISFRLDLRDVRHWRKEIMPVILILYDAVKDKAYWLYIQRFFGERGKVSSTIAGRKIAVSIPMRNIVNEAAIRCFAQFRNNLRKQTEGAISHYD